MQFCEVHAEPTRRAQGLQPLPPEWNGEQDRSYMDPDRRLRLGAAAAVRRVPGLRRSCSPSGCSGLHWRRRTDGGAEARRRGAPPCVPRHLARPGKGLTMRRIRLVSLTCGRRSGVGHTRRAGFRAAARRRRRRQRRWWGLAFVLMVAMVVGIGLSLFFMDHVRRSRLPTTTIRNRPPSPTPNCVAAPPTRPISDGLRRQLG